jgi:endoglucanase
MCVPTSRWWRRRELAPDKSRHVNAAETRTVPSRAAPSAAHLPRWRGFNLVERFSADHPDRNTAFLEEDFERIASWGFDFVRLPMDYRTWTDPSEPRRLDEDVLRDVDRAVSWGERYGIHVDINFHRAPGYCVNRPKEPTELWTDAETQDLCAHQWAVFAERYRGVPNERVSFNLLNEPMDVDEETHNRVIRRLIEAIRAVDVDRLIIVDGLDLGWTPIFGLAGDGVAQSLHSYDPWRISHHGAPWFPGAEEWDEPSWPLRGVPAMVDRDALRRQRIRPWKSLEERGVGIHVGEFGTFNRTPHAVALAWMSDCLSLFREAGWGWSLWNLRGAYGPVDSGRLDVEYEALEGHLLDREMLEILRGS